MPKSSDQPFSEGIPETVGDQCTVWKRFRHLSTARKSGHDVEIKSDFLGVALRKVHDVKGRFRKVLLTANGNELQIYIP